MSRFGKLPKFGSKKKPSHDCEEISQLDAGHVSAGGHASPSHRNSATPAQLQASVKNARKVAGKAGKVASAFKRKLHGSLTSMADGAKAAVKAGYDPEGLAIEEDDSRWLEESDGSDEPAFFGDLSRRQSKGIHGQAGGYSDCSGSHSRGSSVSADGDSDGDAGNGCRKRESSDPSPRGTWQTDHSKAQHNGGSNRRPEPENPPGKLPTKQDINWDASKFKVKPLRCGTIWDIPTSKDPNPAPRRPQSADRQRENAREGTQAASTISNHLATKIGKPTTISSADLWPNYKPNVEVGRPAKHQRVRRFLTMSFVALALLCGIAVIKLFS